MVSPWCAPLKPIVVPLDCLGYICLPQMWFVSIDWHWVSPPGTASQAVPFLSLRDPRSHSATGLLAVATTVAYSICGDHACPQGAQARAARYRDTVPALCGIPAVSHDGLRLYAMVPLPAAS